MIYALLHHYKQLLILKHNGEGLPSQWNSLYIILTAMVTFLAITEELIVGEEKLIIGMIVYHIFLIYLSYFLCVKFINKKAFAGWCLLAILQSFFIMLTSVVVSSEVVSSLDLASSIWVAICFFSLINKSEKHEKTN